MDHLAISGINAHMGYRFSCHQNPTPDELSAIAAKKVLTVRNILVDMQSHQVYKDGLPVSLKPMEYDLFVLLLQNKNIALGREGLLKGVWGENYLGESRTVDVHIGQLRKKLELYDETRTIPKLGYRLEE